MGYYVRVLSPESKPVSPSLLREAVKPYGGLVDDLNNPPPWKQLVITNAEGDTVCLVDRDEISEGDLVEEEIAEFREGIAESLPTSAAEWLQSYLNSVRTIYAFQVIAFDENGWGIIDAAKAKVWESVGGILQADGEGFTNEDGYHILWQFNDESAWGEWWMAILRDSRWHNFKIDLGNEAHREAFKAGEIPAGVECED